MKRMRENPAHPVANLSLVLVLALLALLCLATVALGVAAYTGIQKDASANGDARLAEGYLRAKLRAADCAGGIALEERDGTFCLRLNGESFATLIYVQGGKLCELLWSPEDGAPELAYGEALMNAQSFTGSIKRQMVSLKLQGADGRTQEVLYTLRAEEDAP